MNGGETERDSEGPRDSGGQTTVVRQQQGMIGAQSPPSTQQIPPTVGLTAFALNVFFSTPRKRVSCDFVGAALRGVRDTQVVKESFRRNSRRRRVLSGYNSAIYYGEGLPVWNLFEQRSHPFKFILDQEGHHFREMNLLFFPVGETRNTLTFDQRNSLIHHAMKHCRRVADSGHRLTGVVEGLDQRNGNRIVDQIPHRTMPADVKDGVEVLRPHVSKLRSICEHPLCRRVMLEPRHGRGLILRKIALRIDRWLSTFGRCQ